MKNKNNKKRFLFGGSIVFAIVAMTTFHHYVVSEVEALTDVTVKFYNEKNKEKRKNPVARLTASSTEKNAAKKHVKAFREIEPFDKDSKNWSNYFDNFAAAGALVFDANQDGKADVYLAHNNNSWTRPTDENGVLLDEPYNPGNGLYLNQGNDDQGNPVFSQVKKLAGLNDTYQREELLIENFLFPREGANDLEKKIGRQSTSAISSDINNDGLPDLIVANVLPGMIWSHSKTQRVFGQFVRPVGRQAVNSKVPISAQGMYFIKDYHPEDQINDLVASSRGMESYGANSVFLNMGDKDNDGIPEWQDATDQTGLAGSRTTVSLISLDVDLDGDLDLFEANVMDPDYWPGGATALAGAANQLYINQLAETGELKFVERSAEMNIDGLYDDENPIPDYYRLKKYPVLPSAYSIAMVNFEAYKPEFLEINGEQSEKGQISWAATAQDVNDDGYPDIWVANDLGYLRLYLNKNGKTFEQPDDRVRAGKSGYWMSISPADFNNDLKEDIFAGNMGGSAYNLSLPLPDPYSLFKPVFTSSTMAQQWFSDKHSSKHTMIDGADYRKELDPKVMHSDILPPDAATVTNIRPNPLNGQTPEFNHDGLDPYEFAWGSTAFDVQNDGRMDLYWLGCLYGRGGGIFPIMGSGPGRLLVNQTEHPSKTKFADLTAEHQVFNIQELKYDKLQEGFIYRKSPLQNWGKRSTVYSFDISSWSFQGTGIIDKISNHDLIQCSENGRAAVSADLNNDGFADLILRNMGGYDSRSSKTVNLKAKVNGQVSVVPPHDANFPDPTNFEPGSTRTFINTYKKNNWIKVILLDDEKGSFNRDAIGAKIIVNNKNMQIKRSGGSGFLSNYSGPVLFGLGEQTATEIEIHWPDKHRTISKIALPQYKKGILTISKSDESVSWEAHNEIEP